MKSVQPRLINTGLARGVTITMITERFMFFLIIIKTLLHGHLTSTQLQNSNIQTVESIINLMQRMHSLRHKYMIKSEEVIYLDKERSH